LIGAAMPSLALLIPSWLDGASWAGVFFAAFVFVGVGRALTLGRATAETAMVAGWGGAVLVLTVWGIITPMSLRVPAILLCVIGIAAHGLPALRLGKAEWRAIGRMLAVALPLLAVMASARPSLPDTWLNLLPNAAYIYDHGFFPSDTRPPAHSFIAGAPYNMQLAAFIAALVTPGFPPSAMIGLNLLWQLAAALLFARLATGDDGETPSWTLTALGLLLATALNPGFVPRYHLSAYSETSVTVTVAFAGWFAVRAIDRLNSGRDARLDFWLLALTLAALVNIKQEAVMLVASVLLAAGMLTSTMSANRNRAILGLVVAAVPAAILYLTWRWYVLSHFELGELKTLPFSQWHLLDLPLILWNMLRAAGNRFFLYLCLGVVTLVALSRLRSRSIDLPSRAAVMLASVAVFYNATLVFAYVAHFEGEMGIGAHSYFRYNTHLGLLLMVAAVLLTRQWNWTSLAGRWRHAVPALIILAALLDPFPFLRLLRFDLEVPSLRIWALAKAAAPAIGPAERLVLILPGDNGSVAPALEAILRYAPPRRPDIELQIANDPATALRFAGFDRALLSCAADGVPGVPPGEAALLTRAGSAWRADTTWRYEPVPPRARWSEVLAPAALCLDRSRRGG
jgi:hypothetical protein